jgi:hypothetical protein
LKHHNAIERLDIDTSSTSNVPEAPMSPRSDLGINSPTFDSRSEVSLASRLPVPPESPRIDPLNSIEAAQALRKSDAELSAPSGAAPDIVEDVSAEDSNLSGSDETPTEDLPSIQLTPADEKVELVIDFLA